MSYRDDIAALAARKAALDVEVAQRTKERDEAAQLLAEATAKLHEQEHAERLARRRAMTPTRSQRAVMAATVMSTLAASAAVGHYSTTLPEAPPVALTALPLPIDEELPVFDLPSLPAGLPIECHAYYWEIRTLAACDEIPVSAALSMQQAFDEAAKAWSQLPAEALAGLANACAAGRDAVHQTSLQVCHPRPPEHDLLAR